MTHTEITAADQMENIYLGLNSIYLNPSCTVNKWKFYQIY